MRTLIFLSLVGSVTACGGSNYPAGSLEDNVVPTADVTAGFGCIPDANGVVDDAELPVVLGGVMQLRVTTEPRTIDLEGTSSAGGHSWDLSGPTDGDLRMTVRPESARDYWFADRLNDADAITVIPFDAGGELVTLLGRPEGALVAFGSASAEEEPEDGETWLRYDAAVELLQLPLRVGDAWTSAGEVTNGRIRGLPIAVRHEYEINVEAEGELLLPELAFDRVLQVVTHVHQEAVVGEPLDFVQISWIAECYGEVARVTSPLGVSDLGFDTASEIRRLSF